jgi:hypothetical protein
MPWVTLKEVLEVLCKTLGMRYVVDGRTITFSSEKTSKSEKNVSETNSNNVPEEDIIEVALDYIYGRQLHEKNPELGTTLLYNEAKDGNKSAQRVFVQAIAKGGLNLKDESLNFDLIEVWVENAAKEGVAVAFRLLGNLAYARGNYEEAIKHWKSGWSKGDMTSLKSLALLYDRFAPVDEQEAKKLTKFYSDKDAIFHYEKALEYFKDDLLLMIRLAILKFATEEKKLSDGREAEKLLKKCYEQEPKNERVADLYGRVARVNAQEELKRCNKYYEEKYKIAQDEEKYKRCEQILKQWKQSVDKIQQRIRNAERLIKNDK